MKHLVFLSIAILAFLTLFLWVSSSHTQNLESLKKGVVKITTTTFEGVSKTGTGFIVRLEANAVSIVTASHVVEGGGEIDVQFFTARNRFFPAKVIGMEGGDLQGLAVISVSGDIPGNLSVLNMNLSISIGAGEPVSVIGFPRAGGPWAVSRGEIVARKGKVLTFSGAIEEGNSGGPLLKAEQVIGIVVAKDVSQFAYAVPAVIAKYFMESWGVKFGVQLRSQPASVTPRYVIQMIGDKGFHHPDDLSDKGLSPGVIGSFQNEFEPQTINDGKVVIDHATGLMWQQSGTANQCEWEPAKGYINELNKEQFAGFLDWRLPTVEELASLLTYIGMNKGLFIHPLFDPKQKFCWSSDGDQWYVHFEYGIVAQRLEPPDPYNYARAVRTYHTENPPVPGKTIDRLELARMGISSRALKNTRIVFFKEHEIEGNIKLDLFLINPDGTELKPLTNNPSDKNQLSLSPDGKNLTFWSDFHSNLGVEKRGCFLINIDGSGLLHLSNIEDYDAPISWSPDSKKIIFPMGDDVCIMNANNTNLIKLTNTPEEEEDPSYSPDGKKVAFLIDDRLHIMDSNGENQKSVFPEDVKYVYVRTFAWSPNSKKIIAGGNLGTFLIDADGTKWVRISDKVLSDYPYPPSWSPDSKKIAFGYDPFATSDGDIYVINADGTNIMNLTKTPADEENPTWSPDGSKIAFVSDRFGNWEIYTMNPDGSNQVRITDTPENERMPLWSPFIK